MSIDKKDLRVGNWFKWNEFASMGKGYDFIRSGTAIDYNAEFKEPIPISNEVLEKIGFTGDVWFRKQISETTCIVLGKRSTTTGLPMVIGIEQMRVDGFTIQEAAKVQLEVGEFDDTAFSLKGNQNVYLGDISYLHELQNFHYSVANTELQINL